MVQLAGQALAKSELLPHAWIMRRWMALLRVSNSEGLRVAKRLDQITWSAAASTIAAGGSVAAQQGPGPDKGRRQGPPPRGEG